MKTLRWLCALLLLTGSLAHAQTYPWTPPPLQGNYTYATLPTGNLIFGTPATTSDQGVVYWNGTTWQSTPPTFGPGGIQPALGANVLTATLASTVNNYAPTGWGATVTTARLTAASGGSTVSGFASAGFINGQWMLVRNMSATDNITFLHLSGSSSSTNQFSNQSAGSVILPPLGAAPLVWDSGKWVFF